jgi:hypothetical protein
VHGSRVSSQRSALDVASRNGIETVQITSGSKTTRLIIITMCCISFVENAL